MQPPPLMTTDATDALAARAQQRFWRSLAEAEGVPEAKLPRPIDSHFAPNRRDFMKLMGASIALAGVSGCAHGTLEKIVPYRAGPAEQTYGKPVFYASVLPRDGYGVGLLVETNMGRPTKIEGNPSHPASLGATDAITQAGVRSITVKIFYNLGDTEQVKSTTLSPSKGQLSDRLDFILPSNVVDYDYEITWQLKGNRTVSSGRKRASQSVLFVDEVAAG